MTRSLLLLACCTAAPLAAQQSSRPFEISDNSFLVEEAFNQEAGIFQNVLLVQRPAPGEWSFEFTQEWPFFGQRHQLSYTVPLEALEEPAPASGYQVARGTIALHYRYQLTVEEGAGVATSPRISLLIPRWPAGDRQVGMQFNLPVSKQFNNVYVHANAGVTVAGIRSNAGAAAEGHAAASLIYRAWPMTHLMLETVYDADGWVLAPGVRTGLNAGDTQWVLGVAVPGYLLVYLSYELPFKRRP